MIRIALLRHGATAWNQDGRLQGRADQPLLEAERRRLARLRLPAPFRDADWISSPLRRAVETALLLGADRLAIEPRMVEMDWGRYEGRRLADLRRAEGDTLAVNEARGLDFRPAGGESPREVQRRAFAALAERRRDTVAVTHKGIIRALLALATGWDMTGRSPHKLDWERLQVLALDGGGLSVAALNLALEPR